MATSMVRRGEMGPPIFAPCTMAAELVDESDVWEWCIFLGIRLEKSEFPRRVALRSC